MTASPLCRGNIVNTFSAQDPGLVAPVITINDLDVDLLADPAHVLLKLRPLIAAVGVELQQEREQAEQRAHQHRAAVAILHIGSMDNGAQQQTLGIYQEVALLALAFPAS
jgi:hypothetical protein